MEIQPAWALARENRSMKISQIYRRREPSMFKRLIALVFVLAWPISADADLFVTPIGGTAYKDWTIVNYVDLNPGSGILDWRGGNRTYNGHTAIDFTLPNFAAMDAGVDVYAATSGTVWSVHDGEYDRWSRANPNPGVPANYVVLNHGNGLFTEYYHLKNSSVSVSVGQTVTAGQKLGEVGSSGYSSDAHLHFGVYQNGYIETYLNAAAWWQSPLPYSGDVSGTLDFGITNKNISTNDFVERPLDYDVFYQSDGAGQVAFSWVNLFGFNTGDQLDYYFYKPDGSQYAHWNWTTGDISYGWWVGAIGLPDVPDLGEWSINVRRNGATLYDDSFVVAVPEPSSIGLIWLVATVVSSRRSRRFCLPDCAAAP